MSVKTRRELDDEDEKEIEVKIPLQFSIKDVVVVVGAIITVVLSWGAFQTRVSNLELRDQLREEQIRDLKQEIKDISKISEIRPLEYHHPCEDKLCLFTRHDPRLDKFTSYNVVLCESNNCKLWHTTSNLN